MTIHEIYERLQDDPDPEVRAYATLLLLALENEPPEAEGDSKECESRN